MVSVGCIGIAGFILFLCVLAFFAGYGAASWVGN